MRKLLVLFLIIQQQIWAQQHTLELHFEEMPNEWVKLAVYKGLKSEILDSIQLNNNGLGILKYDASFKGIGFIINQKNKVLSVVLNQENAKFKGKTIQAPENIICTEGNENKNYISYINTFPKYQQADMAWDFLHNLYAKNQQNKNEKKVFQQIVKEQNRIKVFEENFYKQLPHNSFVAQYIPWYKLINSVSYIAQNKPQEIPAVINELRNIDVSNTCFYNSGLLQNALDMQISLILKHFGNNPRGFTELRISVDFILKSLINDEEKLNHIADYLFERLEQKSLFEVSEYLALQLLNQNSCKLNDDLAKQLEIYRKMKVGNTAPSVLFTGDTYRNGYEISDVFLNSNYTVVVFGASWCPGCTEMMPLLVNAYPNWQKRGVEIIFVSLDTHEEEFKQYAQKFPFISTCDFKKWEGENVSNYYVFATPTMFVLDENNKIVLRPHHPKQIDDWIKK
jgi:thiol-disulfide isomerase/thioredoxin